MVLPSRKWPPGTSPMLEMSQFVSRAQRAMTIEANEIEREWDDNSQSDTDQQDETESESVARSQGKRSSLKMLGKLLKVSMQDDDRALPELLFPELAIELVSPVQVSPGYVDDESGSEDDNRDVWDPENFNSDDIKDPDTHFEFSKS